MRAFLLFAVAVMISPCIAQTPNKTEVFPDKDVTSKLALLVDAAKVPGSSGATLGNYPSSAIKLSVRTASGGGEIHGRFDDIFVVTQGKAILITGGNIVNAQTDKNGETKGTSVENGTSQAISKGDIIHIPAGTPHQLIIAPGDIFQTIAIKVEAAR